MKTILFVATHPDQPTGYGTVCNQITNYLARYYNVYVFAYHNIPELKMNREINKNIKFIDVLEEERKLGYDKTYGDDLIEKYMIEIKPDILFIYNDILVTCRLYNALRHHKLLYNYKSILYIDLVYDFKKIKFIKHIDRNTDHIYTFTKHWRDNLIDMGISRNKITVFNHGFIKKPVIDNARQIFNLPKNKFVILNSNRNSYRKAYDITIRAFLHFYKKYEKNDDIVLIINCAINTDGGYDLVDLIEIECLRNNLDFNKIINDVIKTPINSGNISDYMMNVIHNATDIGINTCIGEGFGLCNLEHASLGKPQIVANVGGLIDILPDKWTKKIDPVSTFYIANGTDAHGGYGSVCDYKDFADAMEYYYLNRNIVDIHGKNLKTEIENRFKWDNILQFFHKHFKTIT